MSKTFEDIITAPSLVREQWLSPEFAVREVLAFERRFGSKHLMLACHAALPLILSPELLNLIHINFLEEEQISWVAEVDFLLSPLCRPIDESLFEVEPSIREVLLVDMENQFDFERPLRLAEFLQFYLVHKSGLKQRSEITRTQRWIAQAYIEPDRVIEELLDLQESDLSQPNYLVSFSEQVQIINILEILAEPLERANQQTKYKYLINNSRVVAQSIYGYVDKTIVQQKSIDNLRQSETREREKARQLELALQKLQQTQAKQQKGIRHYLFYHNDLQVNSNQFQSLIQDKTEGVELLKIFMASSSDVVKERRYVIEVIDEINRTIAPNKGVMLKVVRSEENVFPGYNPEGGQAVLNAQIANMKEYALFVGIMWNRVGTPTPRAESGTIEEFKRAVRANKSHEKPEIWFYFRKSKAHLDTQEKLEQAKKVVTFKNEVQRKALTHDYNSPSNFRDRFRQDISLWLNARPNKTSRPRTAAANRTKKSSVTPTNSQPPTEGENKQKKSISTSPAVDNKRKPSTTSTTKKRSPAGSRSTTRITSISSSGAWVMLNDNFFLTQSVETQANQTVTLHISPTNSEQEAALRNLQPEQSYNKKPIAYAYQDDAAIMQVKSVVSQSIKGKTIFILTLSQDPSSQRSNSMEINFNSYSADQIAELRARLLLLNETPSIHEKNNLSQIDFWVEGGYSNAVNIKKNIFPNLWKKLKIPPSKFLSHARLVAVYYLKMSWTVEDILELKLGLIKGNVMSVQFRGKRKSPYINQESAVIQFKGTCPLNG
jgi:hypothetical protein